MSQAPDKLVDQSRAQEYLGGLAAVRRAMYAGKSWSGHERNCCFLNTSGDRFANVSAASGLDFVDDGRAIAATDWDHDGRVDLWISNRTAPRLRLMCNRAATDNHFLVVRLEGRQSNRDAIGARVEVSTGDNSTKLVQTLHAGNSYLSQSSKWLHFGLGQVNRIDRVVVHWPSGQKQEFGGLSTDRRYRLIEGRSNATVWSPPNRNVRLQPSNPSAPKPVQQVRRFLAERFPLPHLAYQTYAQGNKLVSSYVGQPVLISLWATWCQPCLEELAEFAKYQDQLRDAGLKVVALSLDGLRGDAHEPGNDQQWLVDHGIPFASGRVTDLLLQQVQLVHNQLCLMRQPLAVPLSLLLDNKGQLAAFYQGSIGVERLLEDVTLLRLPQDQLNSVALPYHGRWYQEPILRASTFFQLGVQAHMDGKFSQASTLYRQALKRQPDHPESMNNLGLLAMRQGNLAKARAFYERSLSIRPNNAAAHHNLGKVLEGQGTLVRAEAEYRKAVDLQPDLVQAYFDLGNVLVKTNRLQSAVTNYRRALKLKPDHEQAQRHLSAVLTALGDSTGSQKP